MNFYHKIYGKSWIAYSMDIDRGIREFTVERGKSLPPSVLALKFTPDLLNFSLIENLG